MHKVLGSNTLYAYFTLTVRTLVRRVHIEMNCQFVSGTVLRSYVFSYRRLFLRYTAAPDVSVDVGLRAIILMPLLTSGSDCYAPSVR